MKACNNTYNVQEETLLKAAILSRGVVFSETALKLAEQHNAKRQNCVYNMPANAEINRPQELFIENSKDGYSVVVSCVAQNNKTPVYIDVDAKMNLVAKINGKVTNNVKLKYVEEPEYYKAILRNGQSVRSYVSACGYDELNIIPWKGCAIPGCCKFCGINHFIKPHELSAFQISRDENLWNEYKESYINNLKDSVKIALQSSCYSEHSHVILIAGNLDNNHLNLESQIFADIAHTIAPICKKYTPDGIIAVLTPPNDVRLINEMKSAGISKVVYNLEVTTKEGQEKYCPGKYTLGENYFLERLEYSLRIMGKGNVWTNLVYGLENKETVLNDCSRIVKKGIVVSANVLHLDKGNKLDCGIPDEEDILDFFYRLEQINASEGFTPFYCSKALRTSLSNEAHDERIIKI